jgi:aspartyl-tRNA(Asn)/glutamyl-tRNA(Gln) amidotransferase subunit A
VPHIHQADLFSTMSCIGPMARSVDEVAACFDAIAGFDPRDPHSRVEPIDDARDIEVRGLRCGWLPRVGNRLVDAEVSASCEAAVRHLEHEGARVETVDEDFAALEEAFLVFLHGGLAARLGRYMANFGEKIAPSLRRSIEEGARWSAADWANALGQRTGVYRRVVALFRRFDVLVSPTLSRQALAVDHDPFEPISIGGETAGSIRGAWYPYTWPFNLSGHPAVSLPCGWSSDGLPIGLQITARRFEDALALRAAAAWEALAPWPRLAPEWSSEPEPTGGATRA